MQKYSLRNPSEESLYNQATNRVDYEYIHSDVVSCRTAYKDYVQKAQSNLMWSHALGGVVAILTKQKIRNFFAVSLGAFTLLNYSNDSSSRKIIEKSAQNNIERLNVMMDLK